MGSELRYDLLGQTFGRLYVTEHLGSGKWRCLCECGGEARASGGQLRNGRTKSCGCLRKDVTKKRRTKHGHTANGQNSPTYKTYKSMLARCLDPKHQNYKFYGGRGITICDRWIGDDGFTHFLEDMGSRPKGKSIDRVDPNQGYFAANCRWVAHVEQCRNRRSSTPVETVEAVRVERARGDTLKVIAERHGMNISTVHNIVTGKTWA